MARDLQNNPIVFWLLAAIAVGSFMFAIYTFQITKPSRELSYRVFYQNLTLPNDLVGKFKISTPEGEELISSGYLKELDIWNSGNLEIDKNYVLSPIQIRFTPDDKLIEVSAVNVPAENVVFVREEGGFKIEAKQILAKAGFKIRYYSKISTSVPTIGGLVADPIRGGTPIRDASLLGFSFQKSKTERWYVDIFAILALPIALLSLIMPTFDFKPNTKRGKFFRTFLLYALIVTSITYIMMQVYDMYFSSPPF